MKSCVTLLNKIALLEKNNHHRGLSPMMVVILKKTAMAFHRVLLKPDNYILQPKHI